MGSHEMLESEWLKRVDYLVGAIHLIFMQLHMLTPFGITVIVNIAENKANIIKNHWKQSIQEFEINGKSKF